MRRRRTDLAIRLTFLKLTLNRAMLNDTLKKDFLRRVSELETRKKRRLREIAGQLVWWESPDDALQYPERLVARAMTYGTWDEVCFLQEVLGEEVFKAVFVDPPSGILDEASWAYWHRRLGSGPIPPFPRHLVWQA